MESNDPKSQLKEAESILLEAKEAVSRRKSREAVRLAHLACFHAATALWLAARVKPVFSGQDYDLTGLLSSSGTKSLAAFYRQLCTIKLRLGSDRESQLHIEEASTWVRQARHFLERMETLCKRNLQ